MAPKSDPKLDIIIEQLKSLEQLEPMSQKINDLHNSLGQLRDEVSSVTYTVNNHEDRLRVLEQNMATQKEHANFQQQQLRALTIRLLNVPTTTGEATNNFSTLRETVYNRFLEPLLQLAKVKNELSAVPPPNIIIESCFRPYAPAPGKQPPPVIIKLSSRQFKVALMKHRKELPSPTADETASGITRFILVEDLTPDNHRFLAALSKSKLTAKVWSVDGNIKFTKLSKPTEVITVKSVYESVEKCLKG